MNKDKNQKIEDPQELQRKLEELEGKQKRYAMVNEANKEEIYRINFNKVVRKQLMEPKKKGDGADRSAFNMIGKSTDRGGEDSDDVNLSKISGESGSSGGSSNLDTDNEDEMETKKGKTPPGKGKGKPSDLLAGKDNLVKAKGATAPKDSNN